MVDEIIRLIILEASNRKGQDLVGRIVTVQVEIMLKMMEILSTLREHERSSKESHKE